MRIVYDNKRRKYFSTPDDKPTYAAITIECSKWNDSTSGWHSSRGTSFFCTDFRYANRAVSLGKMSRNLRCTTGSCGWCAIVVLSFAPLRIVNNDVSGSIRLAEFFDSPLPVSSWLIETVVEGTTACNCSFRETKVLPGFCGRWREPWFSVTSIANVFFYSQSFLSSLHRCLTSIVFIEIWWRSLFLQYVDDWSRVLFVVW